MASGNEKSIFFVDGCSCMSLCSEVQIVTYVLLFISAHHTPQQMCRNIPQVNYHVCHQFAFQSAKFNCTSWSWSQQFDLWHPCKDFQCHNPSLHHDTFWTSTCELWTVAATICCMQRGCTPLWIAACHGHAEVALFLIRAGARLEARNKVCWKDEHTTQHMQASRHFLRQFAFAHSSALLQ